MKHPQQQNDLVSSMNHSLYYGVNRSRSDPAVVSSVPSQLDVSPISPAGTPGVFQQPVVAPILGAVTNDQHSVVK